VRIARLADYSLVLLAHLARAAPSSLSARQLALETRLPLPTVSKLLQLLSHAALLAPHRGSRGGYSLTRSPEAISVGEVLNAVEGPLALTDCAQPGACELEAVCPNRTGWNHVTRTLDELLHGITLADVLRPRPAAQLEEAR
jgi:FeS assembly SUF system regulator